MEVAHWLSRRPEVKQVLHPALPGAPGHAIWKRDFTGACSLFGVEFKPEYLGGEHARVRRGAGAVRYRRVVGRLREPGAADHGLHHPHRGSAKFAGPLVRLHIGLEDVADLIADLEQGLKVMRAFKANSLPPADTRFYPPSRSQRRL